MASRIARYIRSYFPVIGATKEEKLNFVKYSRSENETELSEMTKSCSKLNINGTDSLNGIMLSPDELNASDNRITEWQAGWNITNAIQVFHKGMMRYVLTFLALFQIILLQIIIMLNESRHLRYWIFVVLYD